MNDSMLDRLMGVVLTPGSDGFWIVVVGSFVAAACALIGCFLVLRRMSMLGDAISHAVLPGIVLAFLFSGSRNIVPMILGAGALGLFTAFATDVLNRHGKLATDASIGVTFTVLFAVGVILVSRFAGQVDLDLDCVLYGEILYAPFNTISIGGTGLGPRSAWVMGSVMLANLAFIVFGWKQLKLCAFDAALAAALGVKVVLWHYLLMAFVSATTVAAFESVGVILVVGMLIVPPNTAYLLTDRLWLMHVLAVAFGVASAIGGYLLATALNGSIAGAMATVSGGFYLLAALFGPRHGVLSKRISQRRLRSAHAIE